MCCLIRRAYQSAEILAALLGLGQSRIVPEYSFLDPRCVQLPCCFHRISLTAGCGTCAEPRATFIVLLCPGPLALQRACLPHMTFKHCWLVCLCLSSAVSSREHACMHAASYGLAGLLSNGFNESLHEATIVSMSAVQYWKACMVDGREVCILFISSAVLGAGVCRGMGALEGLTWASANAQVRSGDLLRTEWRPPRGTDGTPHESISDVLVRMRQVVHAVAPLPASLCFLCKRNLSYTRAALSVMLYSMSVSSLSRLPIPTDTT